MSEACPRCGARETRIDYARLGHRWCMRCDHHIAPPETVTRPCAAHTSPECTGTVLALADEPPGEVRCWYCEQEAVNAARAADTGGGG